MLLLTERYHQVVFLFLYKYIPRYSHLPIYTPSCSHAAKAMEQWDKQWILATVLILLHRSHMIQTSWAAAMRYILQPGLNNRDESVLCSAVFFLRRGAFNSENKQA